MLSLARIWVISACLFFQSFTALAEMGAAAKPLLASNKKHVHTVSCRHSNSILENLKAAGQDIDKMIGAVSACNRGANNSFKITCEKLKIADQTSFRAEFDYSAKPGQPNYVGCSSQRAPELVEALHLSDMAQASDQSLSCNTPLLKAYRDTPGSAVASKLNKSAHEAFLKIQARLREKMNLQKAPQAQADLTDASCGHGEDSKFPTVYCTQNRNRALANKETVKKLDLEMAVLINQIPYGSDARMREKIIDLAKDPNVTLDEFVSSYRPVMNEIADDFQNFERDLQATKKGDQYYLTPSLRAQFMGSPTYDELMSAKPNLDPSVKQVMTCRNENEKSGKATYNKGLVVASILSAAATGGLSLSGVALTGAARAAFVATDLALMGLDSGAMLGQIYDTCYKNVSVIADGKKCSPEQGLNAVITKASTAECATNVVMGLAVAGGMSANALAKAKQGVRAADELVPPTSPRQAVGEIIDEAPVQEIVVTARKKPSPKKKPASITAETTTPSSSITRDMKISRRKFTSENLKLGITTEKQNIRWVEVADMNPQPEGIRYLDTENAAVKALNDSTLDKNFVTAMTNKHKQLVMDKIKTLEAKYPDVEFLPYSDFKSFRYAFKPKPPLKDLPPGFYSDVDSAFKQANKELSDLLKRNGLVEQFTDSRDWFKAGFEETADGAADLSRSGRGSLDTAPRGENHVRTRDATYLEARENDLKLAELYRGGIQGSMKGSDLLEESRVAGQFIPKAEVFDAVRKTNTPQETQAFLLKTTGSKITVEEAKKLRQYTSLVDTFSPSLRITKRQNSVLNGKHGGFSIDLVGAGSKNLKCTSNATVCATNIDDVFAGARAGEKEVTAILDAKKLEVRQTAIPILKKHGIKARFVASGDDITIVPINKPMSDAVKKEVIDALAKTEDPSSFRMGIVGSGVRNTQDRMILATTMEDVVKKTVLKVNIPPEVRKKIFISAEANTTRVGTGQVKLHIGGDVSPEIRRQYENAFKDAVQEINKKTDSNYKY